MRISANTVPQIAEYARSGRVVVFDTETTGCSRWDEICQIAAVEYVDGVKAYFGSANLTGAGMGAKSVRKRNFEHGVLTDDPALVTPLVEQFDSIWRGDFCRDCGRRDFCGDPAV